MNMPRSAKPTQAKPPLSTKSCGLPGGGARGELGVHLACRRRSRRPPARVGFWALWSVTSWRSRSSAAGELRSLIRNPRRTGAARRGPARLPAAAGTGLPAGGQRDHAGRPDGGDQRPRRRPDPAPTPARLLARLPARHRLLAPAVWRKATLPAPHGSPTPTGSGVRRSRLSRTPRRLEGTGGTTSGRPVCAGAGRPGGSAMLRKRFLRAPGGGRGQRRNRRGGARCPSAADRRAAFTPGAGRTEGAAVSEFADGGTGCGGADPATGRARPVGTAQRAGRRRSAQAGGCGRAGGRLPGDRLARPERPGDGGRRPAAPRAGRGGGRGLPAERLRPGAAHAAHADPGRGHPLHRQPALHRGGAGGARLRRRRPATPPSSATPRATPRRNSATCSS